MGRRQKGGFKDLEWLVLCRFLSILFEFNVSRPEKSRQENPREPPIKNNMPPPERVCLGAPPPALVQVHAARQRLQVGDVAARPHILAAKRRDGLDVVEVKVHALDLDAVGPVVRHDFFLDDGHHFVPAADAQVRQRALSLAGPATLQGPAHGFPQARHESLVRTAHAAGVQVPPVLRADAVVHVVRGHVVLEYVFMSVCRFNF